MPTLVLDEPTVKKPRLVLDEQTAEIGLASPTSAKPKLVLEEPVQSGLPEKPIGFKESVKREFTKNIVSKIPIAGTAINIVPIFEAAKRLSIPDFDYDEYNKKRFEYDFPGHEEDRIEPEGFSKNVPVAPKYLTKEEDKKVLEKYLSQKEEEVRRGYTWGGRVGQGISALPTWMIEFALTGGVASAAGEPVEQLGKKALGKGAETLVGKAAIKSAELVARAGARTTTGFLPKVAAIGMERQIEKPEEEWATSLAKAWGDTFIESFSEETGQYISKGLAFGVRKLPFGSKFISGLEKTWEKLSGGTAGEFYKKIATAGGYSDIIGEVGEERLGGLMKDIFGVSDREGNIVERVKEGIKQDYTLSNLATEAAVLAVPMGGQVAMSQIGKIGQGKQAMPPIQEEPTPVPEIPTPTMPISTVITPTEGKGKYSGVDELVKQFDYTKQEAEAIMKLQNVGAKFEDVGGSGFISPKNYKITLPDGNIKYASKVKDLNEIVNQIQPTPQPVGEEGITPSMAEKVTEPTLTIPPETPPPIEPTIEIQPTEELPPSTFRERVREKTYPKIENLYQKYVNRFQSIESAVEKAKKLGAEIPAGEDAGIRAREYLGEANRVRSVLEDKTYKILPDGTFEITGEGLKPILNDFDRVSPERNANTREIDFNNYLFAKRTIEDLQRPKGEWTKEQIVTKAQVEEAQNQLNSLRTKYGDLNLFEQTGQRLYDYQQRILHLLVDSGNMSQEQFDTIISKNKHYIPFDRILEEEAPMGGIPVKRFTGARSPVKRIKGSELEKQDPIGSVIKNTYKIMDIAERNTISRNLAKLAENLPDEIKEKEIPFVPVAKIKLKAAIDSDYLQQVKVFAEGLGYYYPAGQVVERKFATPEEVVSHEVGHFLDDKYKLKAGFYKSTKDTKAVGTEIYQFMVDQGQSANRVKKVSERFAHAFEWWLSNRALAKKDLPLFTKKIEGIISDIPELEPLLKIRPTPGLNIEAQEKTIFNRTQFKPKGNVIEYFEDGQLKWLELSPNLYDAMSGLNETSSELLVKILAIPAKTLRVGATITPEFMLRNPIRDQFTALLQTGFGFKPFIDSGGAIADIMGKSEVYNDWLRSGGSYSGFVELSRPALEKAVAELRGKRSLLRNLNIISKAQDISQLFEQATRLGVYKAGIKSGLTPIEAGFESREATVDFGRRGSKTKDMNAVIAFFNAGIQGTDKSIRAGKADPIGLGIKALISITIPSLLLYLRNRKDPDYAEIPRWQRDLFWITKVKDTYVRIPKPFLYGQVFGSMPERFFEYLETKDKKAFDELADSLYNAASPISGEPLSGLLPTAIKPLIENNRNWNFFTERPLFPEYKEELQPSEQYGKYTTETAKLLGRMLKYSPSKIENITGGYFGGTGRYALEGSDWLINEIRKASGQSIEPKRPKELSDYPLVKGFVARSPIGGQSESIQNFYDKKNELNSAYKTYMSMLKTGRKQQALDIKKKYPDLFLSPVYNNYATVLSTYDKEIDFIIKSKKYSEVEKRNKIKRIDRKKVDLIKKLLAKGKL